MPACDRWHVIQNMPQTAGIKSVSGSVIAQYIQFGTLDGHVYTHEHGEQAECPHLLRVEADEDRGRKGWG